MMRSGATARPRHEHHKTTLYRSGSELFLETHRFRWQVKPLRKGVLYLLPRRVSLLASRLLPLVEILRAIGEVVDPRSLKFDPITADFTYIRWLGNRKEIEAMVQTWDKVVVDRDEELKSWVDFVFKAIEQSKAVYAYANNHYQGHGPATIRKFIEFWGKHGLPEIGKKAASRKSAIAQHRLFE